jgi:hypothetical protein
MRRQSFITVSSSQNNDIQFDELVGVDTGYWQANSDNTFGKNNGRVHYNDVDIICLFQIKRE